MPLDETQINKLVNSPSLGAVTYQAYSLIQELKRINDEEYPLQACRIRNVFLCITEYIQEQLWELYDPGDPYGIKGTTGSARMVAIARILHKIYSYIRYLRASSPQQSPPSIQSVLTQLTEQYFPKQENGEPVCVVRPQWEYNLKYVSITEELRKIISGSILDPDGKFGVREPDDIISELWKKWLSNLSEEEKINLDNEYPKQLAILSFAGLDTQDTLLYPILAHELSHFIDFSYKPQLHLQNPLRRSSEIRHEQVQAVLKANGGQTDLGYSEKVWKALVNRTSVCLRELLADLLATRMLGFSFFIAQAEFLKTLAAWPQSKVMASGYPGIKFRLSVIFNHLKMDSFPGNIQKFLKDTASNPSEKTWLLNYLEEWDKRLNIQDTSHVSSQGSSTLSAAQRQLDELVENSILGSLSELNEVVRQIIPDERCPRLTNNFFDRINRLKQELPPSCPKEEPTCFAEIMSASWAYQLLYGEQQEILKKDVEEKFNEYNKTCRLILKAIELIPPLQISPSNCVVDSEELQDAASDNKDWLKNGGVLSKSHILRRISLSIEDRSHLAVVPFNKTAIQTASLDVHLGNWFAVARRTKLKGVRLDKKIEADLLRTIGREETFVPTGKTFLIHPGDLVLGATHEFIALPSDLMAFVEGRSGLGRLGLFVATATQVAPGFHGVVVLELVNAGTVPLEIVPGMPIAQLIFQTMTEHIPNEQLYRGKYHCQIKP